MPLHALILVLAPQNTPSTSGAGRCSHRQLCAARRARRRTLPAIASTHMTISLPLGNDFVIVRMRTNPKPRQHVVGKQTQHTPMQPHMHGVKRLSGMDTFETQARMIWIALPQAISFSGLCLSGLRQARKAIQKIFSQLRFQSSSMPCLRMRPALMSWRTLSAQRASWV